MKIQNSAIIIVAVIAFGLACGARPLQAQSGEDLFQRALVLERSSGDVRAAIGIYEQIVRDFASDRALAARALLRLGMAHEIMGNAEARAAYERLVSDFSDQRESVARARTRLEALPPEGLSVPGTGSGGDGTAGAAGSGLRRLPDVEAAVYAGVVAVSQDGTRVAFLGIGGEAPGGWAQTVGVFDYRDGSTIWMTPSGERVAADGSYGYAVAWSHDGQRVAYTNGLGASGSQTWVARPGEPQRLVFETSGGDFANVEDWLHSGSALVVTITRADASRALGIVSLEDGTFRELGTFEWPGMTARVSPDDRFLVIEGGTRDRRDIHVMAIDGSAMEPLDQHPALDTQPLWSPDGRHVVFHSDRQGSDAVWSVQVEDGRAVGAPRRIMDGADGVRFAGWGDAGLSYSKYVALQDLYTAAIDPESGATTASARMLPFPETGHNSAPRYSPSGDHVAFLRGSPSNRDARRELVILPLNGGVPMVESPPAEVAGRAIGNIRWNPDGSGLTVLARNSENRPLLGRYSLSNRSWRVEALPEGLWGVNMDWDTSWERVYFHGRIEGPEEVVSSGNTDSRCERQPLAVVVPRRSSSALRGP
jgi:Tol biopolymer transport system component